MEVIIAVFLGCWLSGFALWAYKQIKKDYSEVMSDEREVNDR